MPAPVRAAILACLQGCIVHGLGLGYGRPCSGKGSILQPMTALSEYQRLECMGLWRETPEAQRREVLVSFGDATLMIADPRSSLPLAHWSLPAVERRNPGERPALYAPGSDTTEELELADELMIAAIGKVHRLIAARQPHPGRLRRAMLAGALVGVLSIAVLVLPGVLVSHTATVLPMAKRAEIGRAALADVARLTGQPCSGAEGLAALKRLSDRLMGAEGGRLVVVPDGLQETRHLPGRMIVIGAALLARDDPAALSRAVMAERIRSGQRDPLVEVLRFAGLGATFQLLTTGNLPARSLSGYGARILKEEPRPVDPVALEGALAEVGLGSSDGAAAMMAAIPDNDWVALQGICDG